jgi:hypothetical protein
VPAALSYVPERPTRNALDVHRTPRSVFISIDGVPSLLARRLGVGVKGCQSGPR